MNRKLSFVLFTAGVILLIASAVFADVPNAQEADTDTDSACKLVSLFDAWARATAPGMPNGAVFGLLVNLGSEQDVLISADTDVAEAVEFHETTIGDGDVMRMMPVEGGFEVAAQNYLELQPGGLHIMLIGLTQSLVAGETFDLTLTFEQAGDVTVKVAVRDVAEMTVMADTSEMGETDAMAETDDKPMQVDAACAGVHVVGAWARATVPGQPNGAAYGLLLNLTDTDDTLVSASTDAAEVVELHEMMMVAGDVMQMRPLESGIALPAGGTALLKPGGLHVMLINLTAALEAGSTVEFTLTFAQSPEQALIFPVKEREAN